MTRELPDIRPSGETAQIILHLIGVLEAVHALGAGAKLADRLGTAEHQLDQDGELAAAEIELLLQAAAKLFDAAAGAGARKGEPAMTETVQDVAHLVLS